MLSQAFLSYAACYFVKITAKTVDESTKAGWLNYILARVEFVVGGKFKL